MLLLYKLLKHIKLFISLSFKRSYSAYCAHIKEQII